MVSLGQEVIAPYVKADSEGAPLFQLPGRPGQLLPLPGLRAGRLSGQTVDMILKQSATPIHLDRVYETDMAEA